jgi:hypothetical protein
MSHNIERISLNIMAFLAMSLSQQAFSEYVEGIDTTDENGWGLDSTFNADIISGSRIVIYTGGYMKNLFEYSFEEIHLAADSGSISEFIERHIINGDNTKACFVIQNSKDSCYSKVQILKHFLLDANNNDWRYIYRYGTNTTPLNRTLQRSNYDRSVRYKPNNFCYRFDINASHNKNVFAWEPPLSNDNHLQGYIIYVQKRSITIDTTAPINITQWDSVGFTDTTKFAFNYSAQGEYYNIVAVYSEGKSDFLKGWSRLYRPSRVTNGLLSEKQFNTVSIHCSQCGFFISLNQRVLPSMMNIYDVIGNQKAHFSNFTGNRILWNTSQQNIPPGLYLLRAEFPDRRVITQPFTITR